MNNNNNNSQDSNTFTSKHIYQRQHYYSIMLSDATLYASYMIWKDCAVSMNPVEMYGNWSVKNHCITYYMVIY